jgi:hypothetical protein
MALNFFVGQSELSLRTRSASNTHDRLPIRHGKVQD